MNEAAALCYIRNNTDIPYVLYLYCQGSSPVTGVET
jgi:hypothetical protein